MFDIQIVLLVATFAFVGVHLWRRHRRYQAFLAASRRLAEPRTDGSGSRHEDAIEDVTAYVTDAVRAGFEPLDRLREIAFEQAEEEGFEGDAEAFIDALIAEQVAAKRAAEQGWPVVTDCDRIDAAFADLESRGVVARQNFTCCQTCGHAEIQDEVEQAAGEGTVRGYVFYHQQDTEGALAGGGLYLAYGATGETADDVAGIAREACDALRRAGLAPDWNASTSTRIRVPMTWQRRSAEPDGAGVAAATN